MMLGAVPVLAIRLLIPWIGAWVAECDLDLGADDTLPSGAQVLIVGSTMLQGTVDPRGTARFGEKATARVVAGAGAWDTIIRAEHFHNDAGAGVSSSVVTTATASAIGETIVDGDPLAYGSEFFRGAGRASAVLDGRPWYVDSEGVTHVAEWPALSLGSDVDVLTYDPQRRRAELASDEIVWPGTSIADSRFGTFIVRDVEQSFTRSGSRCIVWHASSASSRLGAALGAIVRAEAGPEWLRVCHYRIVSQGVDGRIKLQAVRKVAGLPDTLPLTVWPGMSGLKAKHKPGTEVGVIFLNGDRTQPRVVSFDGRPPLELSIDALIDIKLGEALAYVLRSGDKVMIPGVQPGPGVSGVIVALDPSVLAAAGAPGVGHSKVSA